MHPGIQHSVFAVCDEPYCVWDWDIRERNIAFIEGIDEQFFEYITETHLDHIQGSYSQRAAIALRVNYHLSLETLFSLIAAVLQAPDCVPAWILKASTAQLRKIVELLQRDSMQFPIKWEMDSSGVGFENVAALLFQYTTWAHDDNDRTIENMGNLLYRLADDFLDAYCIKEYNSIKHGFRARAGGFHIAMGIQHQLGVPAPPEEMKSLGGSTFGTSFYSAESTQDAPPKSNDRHFTLRRNALNWLPDATAGRMHLAALLIKNVKSFLSVLNGKSPNEVLFHRLLEQKDFDMPWQQSPGVTSSNMDRIITEADIYRASSRELRDKLTTAKSGPPSEV